MDEQADGNNEEVEVSDDELGFLCGVMAARGIAEPTDEDLHLAFELLRAHLGATDALIN